MKPPNEHKVWCVSSGSAAVLGLQPLRMDAAPTTAYLMLGERCQRACAFCAQARTSVAREGALSRVIWPGYETDQVLAALSSSRAEQALRRVCFQVTAAPGAVSRVRDAVAQVSSATALPICVSVAVNSLAEIESLLHVGAERVTLALDAATPELYAVAKGGSWTRAISLLETAARTWPGHLGTHLIVGLGETERAMVELIQRLADEKISIGLFAFTPVPGTAWGDRQPPELGHYRRIQTALWLIVQGQVRAEGMRFDEAGHLVDYGILNERLRALLHDGEPFRTSGCPGCNRPYYNERPGGTIYNYPQPLTPEQARAAVDLVTN